MEYYLNEWEDAKRPGHRVIDEFHLHPGTTVSNMGDYLNGREKALEQAILDYNCTNKELYNYVRTIACNPERGTCTAFNLETVINDRRSKSQRWNDARADEADNMWKEARHATN